MPNVVSNIKVIKYELHSSSNFYFSFIVTDIYTFIAWIVKHENNYFNTSKIKIFYFLFGDSFYHFTNKDNIDIKPIIIYTIIPVTPIN